MLRRINPVAWLVVIIWLLGAGLAHALTIVTWNLEWFPGRSMQADEPARQKQMLAAQKILKEIKPDIFLAQEVADWASFEKLVAVVPGLQVHTVSSFRDNRGFSRQQVCIASRLVPNSTWSENFKRGTADPPRGFGFAALTLADGKLLFIYTVHLKSNIAKSDAESAQNISKREESVAQLMAHVQAMRKAYKDYTIKGVVIGGDFNTNTDSSQFSSESTIRSLEKGGFWNAWTDVKKSDRLSWTGSSKYPATTFDYLFLDGLGKPQAALLPNGDASDHKPVVVHLDIK